MSDDSKEAKKSKNDPAPILEPEAPAPKETKTVHEVRINAESLEKAFNSLGDKLIKALPQDIIPPAPKEEPKKEKYLWGQEFDIFGGN